MTPGRGTPEQKNPAGSPVEGEPVFLAIGRLRRPHGVRGEINMEVLTDFPERLRPGMQLYIGPDYRSIHLKSRRWHRDSLLVSFKGYEDREQIGELRSQIVYVPVDDRPPLEEGEYYHHQLLGLRVIDEEGRLLGELKEILETGANDVYVVLPESGPSILIPAIYPVILEINLEEGEMRVHLLPGLLPNE